MGAYARVPFGFSRLGCFGWRRIGRVSEKLGLLRLPALRSLKPSISAAFEVAASVTGGANPRLPRLPCREKVAR